jgi:anti-sigma28 factor (negative regulator of flagellin synthesis)
MRINDYRLAGANAGQTERTNETSDATSPSAGRAQGRESDRVEMSSFTGRLSQALATDGERRQARVDQLSNVFAAGKLDTDPGRLSRRMVDFMLGAA